MSRNGFKSAMISVELAASLLLVVVVLFIAIGLFNDNLKVMFANGNFKNIYTGNTSKTFFNAFNRNYDDAQVYVQIMGEQGLKILRQKANNKAVSLIDEFYANAPEDVSKQTVDTASYLAQIINVIVGAPDICQPMKKPSDKVCIAEENNGYSYKVSATGNNLNIVKIDASSNDKGTKSFEGSKSISLSSSITNDNKSVEDKYKSIKTIATTYDKSINADYSLVRTINYFNTKITASGKGSGTLSGLEEEIIGIILASEDENSSIVKSTVSNLENQGEKLDTNSSQCIGAFITPKKSEPLAASIYNLPGVNKNKPIISGTADALIMQYNDKYLLAGNDSFTGGNGTCKMVVDMNSIIIDPTDFGNQCYDQAGARDILDECLSGGKSSAKMACTKLSQPPPKSDKVTITADIDTPYATRAQKYTFYIESISSPTDPGIRALSNLSDRLYLMAQYHDMTAAIWNNRELRAMIKKAGNEAMFITEMINITNKYGLAGLKRTIIASTGSNSTTNPDSTAEGAKYQN